MKLRRLRIEQLRQFRAPIDICDFDDGINLFTGPNESGKSSIVSAIRAAFFERHRSSNVEDLRPYGDSTAAPTIELDFDIGQTRYELSKRFLNRPRCDLKIGNTSLESAEAEDSLAALMGFNFAGRGASKAEHWGIPGLLWLEQGTCHDIDASVTNASDHLRTTLNSTLGEVASTSGDDVLEKVRAERNTLITASTKKPTGPLQAVNTQLQAAKERLAELDDAIAVYQAQVDALGALRLQHDADAIEKPWSRFQRERDEKIALQSRLDDLATTLANDRLQLDQANKNLVLVRQRLADFAAMDEAIVAREKALALAMDAVEAANILHQQASTRLAEAEAAYKQSGLDLRTARNAQLFKQASGKVESLKSRMDSLTEASSLAAKAHASWVDARANVSGTEIDSEALVALEEQGQQLRDLEVRQGAIATRITFDLEPSHGVTLDGAAVEGQGQHLLVAEASLAIPGVGRISITPGGTDLADLARDRSELLASHLALLQQVGVSSVLEAVKRYASHRMHVAQREQAEHALGVYAPLGLDALEVELTDTTVRHADALRELSLLEAPADETLHPEEAEQRQEIARGALSTASKWESEAKQTLMAAETTLAIAKTEFETARLALNDPQHTQRQSAASESLLEMLPLCAALEGRIAKQAEQISNAQPEVLAQDIERLNRSAVQAERSHGARHEEIIRLQTTLQVAGAQGLEEAAAEASLLLQQLTRRQEELSRRAAALDLLVTLLEAKRRDLTRRLQAPLQRRIEHYLKLLMPQATLEIDENLVPTLLTRPGTRSVESSLFEYLSFGAREQLGIICRLAYADLLQAAGKPTLIIFDDVLVYSDDARVALMKRILFDASQRHQILLFTCHPADWNDLGAAPRTMEAIKSVPARISAEAPTR